MSTTMVEHFKEAMRLILVAPIHLTGSYYAFRYTTGDMIRSENIKTANCFCIIGTLHRAANISIGEKIPVEYPNAMGFVSEGAAINWNDQATKDEVLTRFAETINKLEKVS